MTPSWLALPAYQIAIAFACRQPEDVANLGHPIAGQGSRVQDSLATSVACLLSGYAKMHPNGPIEGGFLSNWHLKDISLPMKAALFSHR
jgi:hypothetical protein